MVIVKLLSCDHYNRSMKAKVNFAYGDCVCVCKRAPVLWVLKCQSPLVDLDIAFVLGRVVLA